MGCELSKLWNFHCNFSACHLKVKSLQLFEELSELQAHCCFQIIFNSLIPQLKSPKIETNYLSMKGNAYITVATKQMQVELSFQS